LSRGSSVARWYSADIFPHSIRMTQPVRVIQATPDHLTPLVSLFQAYLRFYRVEMPSARVREFLAARMSANESVIYLATHGADHSVALGFAQLYPTWSSLSLSRAWILNDLYIAPEQRRRGVARCLIARSHRHAAETGATFVELATANDNDAARSLYESLGYEREQGFIRYRCGLPGGIERSAPAS
jgi:ribosomal protein S18 acetylase RimI-like enzyme